MPEALSGIVKFRGDRLFDGAVNIGWLYGDDDRTRAAAEAFVFHGPAYHSVSQDDVGYSHGHRLQDTATFASSIVRRCYGAEDQSFTLAIAGYGTGKSHLALTLGSILRQPNESTAKEVLQGIENADAEIGREVRALLTDGCKPCLVVALNGMQNYDLAAEVTRQVIKNIKAAGLDTRPIDDLRPRFAQAASLVQMAIANTEVVQELLSACEASNIQEILAKLEQQDDFIYSQVHDVLASKNIKITAFGGESVRDVIDVVTREYCGEGKHFQSLAVLFDEFGRYTEFAAGHQHIVGSGALQSLFEGIQNNPQKACFVGFIQYELNAYVQRVAPEHRTEITRYVTRYQSASRVYLSINLETLIANLIEKRRPECLDSWFSSKEAFQESQEMMSNISKWFPQSVNHRVWGDEQAFHTVIRKGCWPLSAFSTWFLFHLAAAGKHLQERSALALLGDAFMRFKDTIIADDGKWFIAPVDLWSEDLVNELLTAEESGQQGSITHAFCSITSRHGARLDEIQMRLLKAVVLASKMGLKASDQDDVINALSELAGLHLADADKGIRLLKDDFNVLEWDESFKAFDILGDSVPRNQFLAFIRQRVKNTYDEEGKSKLFAMKASAWCNRLMDLDCDFAEENKITTREWRYQSVTSNLEYLVMQVKQAVNRWTESVDITEPRGTVIYCYVEQSRDPEAMKKDAAKLLRAASKEAGISALPILVVLLYDEDGGLGQTLAELAILDETLSEQERVQFGNLIAAHKEKALSVVDSRVNAMIKKRDYVSAFREPFESQRLSRVGTEMFSRIYKSALVFPFDGFTTTRGNAASDCLALTNELLLGRLDWSGITAKPVRVKNRAKTVLQDCWGIFAQTNGAVKTRPTHPVVRSLTEKWDSMLSSGEQRILLGDALRKLCLPPYGANLASAGLYLGVFMAPRLDKLSLLKNGEALTISDWVEKGVFRGNFIDISALHDVELLHVGDESSEWETLLDEWEQAESYIAKKEFYLRSEELKQKVRIPPAQNYRYQSLETQASIASYEINKFDDKQDSAIKRIDEGIRSRDISRLAWGAADLADLIAKMKEEKTLWTEHQVQEVEPFLMRARQSVIQYFSEWLVNQKPRDNSPTSIGSFNHFMLHKVGISLKKLDLDDEFCMLEEYTKTIVGQAETLAAARQTIREVELWIETHADAMKFIRVKELRALRQVGKEYGLKLKGLASRLQVSMPELPETRVQLSSVLEEMKKALSDTEKRAKTLWNGKLRSEEEIDQLQGEVDALLAAYEGCDNDLSDLRDIRRALRMYQEDFQRLSDESLTWDEFHALAEKQKAEAQNGFDEEANPWDPSETIPSFVAIISKKRESQSKSWIDQLRCDSEGVASMDVSEANRLHGRASATPPCLTDKHLKALAQIISSIEKRLDQLKVEWLVEKYNELTAKMQKQFIQTITK